MSDTMHMPNMSPIPPEPPDIRTVLTHPAESPSRAPLHIVPSLLGTVAESVEHHLNPVHDTVGACCDSEDSEPHIESCARPRRNRQIPKYLSDNYDLST